MTANHSITSVRAVAYYRMSTDGQEDSICQQQGVMRPKAKLAGIDLIQEFKDEGITGGKMAGRDSFKEMLAFCKQQHAALTPIDAVVCWDTKRFSRASSIETNHYIWEFMQAGVCRLFTHADGWIDFRKEEQRVLFNLRQDISSHRDLRDRSRDISRGKLATHQANYFNGGVTPYGFERLIVDENGDGVERVTRNQKIKFKKEGYNVVLVPSENAEEVEVVRWLYEQYARTETSLRGLAMELNHKGIAGPGSYTKQHPGASAWCSDQIRRILSSPHYTGDSRYGHRMSGTYFRTVGGEIKEAEFNAKRQINPEALVNHNAHDGLIDRPLWEAVQKKLKVRSLKRQKTRAKGFVLSGGLLRCGLCGCKMQGESKHHDGKHGRTAYRYYVCAGNQFKPGTCHDFSIREDRLLPFLVKKLLEVYLSPERLEGLRRQLTQKVDAKNQTDPVRAERLQAQLETIDREIRQGARNLMRAKDHLDLIEEELTSLRTKREQVQRELKALEASQAMPVEEMAKRVNEAIQRLSSLGEQLRKATPDRLRAVFGMIVSRIDLYFEDGPREWRQRFRFAKGVVKFQPQILFAVNSASA